MLALPGHTPGHLGLWDAGTGAAIVIDAVLADGVYDRAGNRLIPPRYYDAGAYEATIRRLRALDPELLLTAHYDVMERAAAREFLDRSLDFVRAVRAAVRARPDTTELRALTAGGRRGRRPVPGVHARARRVGARAPRGGLSGCSTGVNSALRGRPVRAAVPSWCRQTTAGWDCAWILPNPDPYPAAVDARGRRMESTI